MKHMKYVFGKNDMKERSRERLNSDDALRERGGEYEIPFVASTDLENRVYERSGHLMQEQYRLSKLRWLQEDLERLGRKWPMFYNRRCMGTSYSKGRSTNNDGSFSLEKIWKDFLDYSGKDKKYRMRVNKSNREVLEKQLGIRCDWENDNGKDFPIKKAQDKLEQILRVIEITRRDITETSTRLEEAKALLREKIMEVGSGEEHRWELACDSLIRSIQDRAREQLKA